MGEDNTLKILKALSDKTRLEIVRLLLDGERCVCQIFPHVKRTQSTVSIHLAKLEKAGIIKHERNGKKVIYSISNPVVCGVLNSLDCTKSCIKKTCGKQYKKR